MKALRHLVTTNVYGNLGFGIQPGIHENPRGSGSTRLTAAAS